MPIRVSQESEYNLAGCKKEKKKKHDREPLKGGSWYRALAGGCHVRQGPGVTGPPSLPKKSEIQNFYEYVTIGCRGPPALQPGWWPVTASAQGVTLSWGAVGFHST